MLQVSLTKNIQNELNYYSHSSQHYTHLSPDGNSIGSEELFAPSSLSSTRNIRLPEIILNTNRIATTTNTPTNTTPESPQTNRRLSRRYQPYNKTKNIKKSLSNTNISTPTINTYYQTQESLDMEPLFGPILSSSCIESLSSTDNNSILNDDQVFEEFDSFISSPTRFLSSPPPSPILSPSENDDDDMDFNDFPLFP